MHIRILRVWGGFAVLHIVSAIDQSNLINGNPGRETSSSLNLPDSIPSNGTSEGFNLALKGTSFSIVDCRVRARHFPGYPIIPHKWIEALCGYGYGPYPAAAVLPALITWIIPLLSLMLNVHFTGVSRSPARRDATTMGRLSQTIFALWPMFSAWSTQLADPIGATWSLTAKLDVPRQLYRRWDQFALEDEDRRLQPHIFNILWCVHDFGKDLFVDLDDLILKIIRRPYHSPRTSDRFDRLRQKFIDDVEVTSLLINFARNRSWRRSVAAILVYAATMVYSILTTRGATTLDDCTPHTIALREICLFIVAHVALSTAIGAWSDAGNPQLILRSFACRLHKIEEALAEEPPELEALRDGAPSVAAPKPSAATVASRLSKANIAIFDGGSYFFQPGKTEHMGWHEWVYLLLSVISSGSSFAVSFCTSYFTPTRGIGGRSLAELCYLFTWILNFLLNLFLLSIRGNAARQSKKTMYFIWVKDGIVSSAVFLMWLLPFVGWYNTAKSWSAWFSLGDAAYINLELNAEEIQLTYKTYLTLFLAGLSSQVLLASIIIAMTCASRTLDRRPEAAKEVLKDDPSERLEDHLGHFDFELTTMPEQSLLDFRPAN